MFKPLTPYSSPGFAYKNSLTHCLLNYVVLRSSILATYKYSYVYKRIKKVFILKIAN